MKKTDVGQCCIDIIIPLRGKVSVLEELFAALEPQDIYISSIIVIHSPSEFIEQVDHVHSRESVLTCQSKLSKKIQYYKVKIPLYPGAARNLGISLSRADYILFLDANTIPSRDFMPTSFGLLQRFDLEWLPGRTKYSYQGYFQKIILASSLGFLPVTSIPGTLLKKECLMKTGYFLPDVRAAEDIDFMKRLSRLCKMPEPSQAKSAPLSYKLYSSSIAYYSYKWARNCSSNEPYVILAIQKFVTALLLTSLVTLLSLTWNATVAKWDQASPLYAPNIVKLTLFILIFFYILARGVVIPGKKGAFASSLCSPLDVVPIIAISAMLDISKILGFIVGFVKSSSSLFNRFRSTL